MDEEYNKGNSEHIWLFEVKWKKVFVVYSR